MSLLDENVNKITEDGLKNIGFSLYPNSSYYVKSLYVDFSKICTIFYNVYSHSIHILVDNIRYYWCLQKIESIIVEDMTDLLVYINNVENIIKNKPE
jgi:hypothetical protein